VTTPQGSAIVGRIAVMDPGAGNLDQAESASLYKAADGVTPKVAAGAQIQQGALESSNLDAMQGTVQLLSIQREAEMMQRALSVFDNDLDKTSSQDLARV
jgi:flagellar basal-body rod protein FlgF/flagellar basal-body rod protein FlgG